jgi:hypothetical protein
MHGNSLELNREALPLNSYALHITKLAGPTVARKNLRAGGRKAFRLG